MNKELELKKMYWHSRRGMLELDLLLLPFVEECLGNLGEREQTLYRILLEEEDQDLFIWLIGKERAPEENLQEIIDLILKHGNKKIS